MSQPFISTRLFLTFALVAMFAGVANAQSGSRNAPNAPSQSYTPSQPYSAPMQQAPMQQAPAYNTPATQSAVPQTGFGGCSGGSCGMPSSVNYAPAPTTYRTSRPNYGTSGYYRPVRYNYRPFYGYRSCYGSSCCGGY